MPRRVPPVTVDDLRDRAAATLPRGVFDFVDGGAGDEQTLEANRLAFRRITFRPNALQGASQRSQSRSIFGHEVSSPVLLAPTGLPRMVHPSGDLAGARAAARRRTIFTLSTMGSYSIEDVAADSAYPFWFQLYLWRQRDLVASLVARAEQVGCTALVVTVDVPLNGKRERDLRNGFTLPPRLSSGAVWTTLRRPRWLLAQVRSEPISFKNFFDAASSRSAITQMGEYSSYINQELAHPAADFEDLAWIRDIWPRELVVKGIMTGADAVRAVDCGADAIVVSNHGGRQLDGLPATLDVLPEVAGAVAGRADVFLDGGIRRGTDVIKALALGAKACFIGRPWLYGLAHDGEQGVIRVLDILREEIDSTLALLGRRSIDEIDATCIGRSDAPLGDSAALSERAPD